MRFFRYFFWTIAVAHWALGLWFCLTPDRVRASFGHEAVMPLLLFQTIGLIFFALAFGFAYVAERPNHAVPVVALSTLTKSLLLLFTVVGYAVGEVKPAQFNFELTLDLATLPFMISYFFWYYHKPRPTRFVPLIGLFGEKSRD